MLYLFVHTSIVAECLLFVNSNLCICGKVWRVDLLIYTFSPLPRLYPAPPACVSVPYYFIYASILCPNALYAVYSLVYGYVLILNIQALTRAYNGLYGLVFIPLYYTIITLIFQ